VSTIRKRIIELLEEMEMNALELSGALSVQEKDVYDHLEHIRRSIKRENEQFIIDPYHCVACGYDFVKRNRLTRPGRCPNCKGSHIRMAMFSIKVI